MRKFESQLATVEVAMPGPRKRSGKISEIISQNTGPRPTENPAI
jgi:hypothetical protein